MNWYSIVKLADLKLPPGVTMNDVIDLYINKRIGAYGIARRLGINHDTLLRYLAIELARRGIPMWSRDNSHFKERPARDMTQVRRMLDFLPDDNPLKIMGELYLQGKKPDEIGQIFGIGGHTVRKKLQSIMGNLRGLARNQNREKGSTGMPLSQAVKIDDLVDSFLNGKSFTELGNEYGVTQQTIRMKILPELARRGIDYNQLLHNRKSRLSPADIQEFVNRLQRGEKLVPLMKEYKPLLSDKQAIQQEMAARNFSLHRGRPHKNISSPDTQPVMASSSSLRTIFRI